MYQCIFHVSPLSLKESPYIHSFLRNPIWLTVKLPYLSGLNAAVVLANTDRKILRHYSHSLGARA